MSCRTHSNRSDVSAHGLAALVLISACAGAAEPAFEHSIARSGCTQEDISGVEIILSAEPWRDGSAAAASSYIRIEVARPRLGQQIDAQLSPLKRDPAARVLARAALHAGKAPPTWLSGSLSFRQDADTRAVAGSYAFCADDRSCFSGSFAAPWRAGAARCG